MEQTIHELVRKMESDDMKGETTISKYVSFNMRENIEKIEAYLNSKHISGETDSEGREKPFFNIVTAAVNIWFRATDIDRKNIRIKATKAIHYVLAFIATILLQEWMRKTAFGAFLNKWGRSLAKYGSSILKFVEKDGKLHPKVISWNEMIVDAVDFENNPKIEKLWLTPAQLRKRKGYDEKVVKELLDAVAVRETTSRQKKDTKQDYIPVYEVHGELPLSYLTDKEEDEDIYQQQMHVISFLAKKEGDECDDYTLMSGREAKDPYLLTHLIEEDNRTQSIGAVEHLFEPQWMENHNRKTIKDQLDLASKLIFQTSDGNFVGRNVLTSVRQGDILIHAVNQPLTKLNNRANIEALQSDAADWKRLGNEITGISEAMLGAAPKSGTAWRQTEALLYESHSLFEIMTENKGFYLEEMLTKYIIPHLKKKMDTSEEISAILEDNQITQLDTMYVPNEAIRRVNRKIKEAMLSGKLFTREQQTAETQLETSDLQKMLNTLGNQRFIKPSDVSTETWKGLLKDLEWEVDIDITGEAVDRQAVLTTLNTVFATLARNPAVLENPKMKLIFNKILNEVGGISPIELSQTEPRQQPIQQTIPATPMVGGPMAGTKPTTAPMMP